jgi:arylsulfatase A-like enzyme
MTLSRRTLLASAGAPFVVRAAPKPPNLLLILTDQQTHDAMSNAGNPWLKTPAMDSLAARGTRFAETICPYPVCSPSRGSIFTGRMPHETGVRVNGKAIAPGMATMGEVFQKAGYQTVYGGKWHLPKSFDGMTGFEKLIGGSGQGRDMDEPLATACADWLRRKPAGPFLMVASFMNPHDICDWIRRNPGAHEYPEIGKYPPAPANMAIDPQEPEVMQYHRTAGYDLMSKSVGIAQEWRRDDFRHYLHDYYRMVEAVDAQVGRVLGALREAGLEDNTVVCFASDHGEGMGAHRWVQKASFYEESVRVPFVWAGPGVAHRVDRASQSTLADILPTFCELAGVAAPPDQRGRSLAPALQGKTVERPFVVSELLYGDQTREGRMLRTARHKYVVFNNGARPEMFFDLTVDPGETQNLSRSAGHAGLLGEHRGLLKSWISQTGDDFKMPA